MFARLRLILAKIIHPETFTETKALHREYCKVRHDLFEVYNWMDKGSEARLVAYYLLRRADWIIEKEEYAGGEMAFYIVYPEVSRFRDMLRDRRTDSEMKLRTTIRADLQVAIATNDGLTESYQGIWKVVEEAGELLQQLGKLGAFPTGPHPDGKGEVWPRVREEVTDLAAAIQYFSGSSGIVRQPDRYRDKLEKFTTWGLTGVYHAVK